jgi:hypothetical protein
MIVHWLREKPRGWMRRLAINALGCAMTGVVAVVVMIAKAPTSLIVAVIKRWERQLPDVPLVIVESPYRALVGPLLAYLQVLDETWPEDKPDPITFVVIPEYVARSWWERILYNQSAQRLRRALIGRPHTVVVGVPYRRDDQPETDNPNKTGNGGE